MAPMFLAFAAFCIMLSTLILTLMVRRLGALIEVASRTYTLMIAQTAGNLSPNNRPNRYRGEVEMRSDQEAQSGSKSSTMPHDPAGATDVRGNGVL